MLQTWKTQHIIKGLLTRVPPIERLRQRRGSTSGSDSARYCYSVWLRHLTILGTHGFRVSGARVGELGPGDSIGIGLAALLSGAESYAGLDVVSYAAKADLTAILDEMLALFESRAPIPDDREFPSVRPKLKSYEFPAVLIDTADLHARAKKLHVQLERGLKSSGAIAYQAPWHSAQVIKAGTLDLIYSQAVLEHVDNLEETYRAMFTWLKPGGYASHIIDFGAHHLSPFWDGHWAYTDLEWKLVRGRREYLLNREPFSTHLRLAEKTEFEILDIEKNCHDRGVPNHLLASRFKALVPEDRNTRGCVLILRKRQ